MKQIDRLNLISTIGRKLQAQMSYSDIDVYLAGFGIDSKGFQPSANSKWVYVKELLANASIELIIKIADDLEIEHNYSQINTVEASCWRPGHFRLFLSHLSSFKIQASRLQTFLKKYSISAFVAHEDIEPSKEWLNEIEAALYTMDALAALIMPGFKESNWCDQEVGVAVGRGVLIIPVRKGMDPYGFIGKYQGIQASGKTVSEVAENIFQTIINSPKTRNKMIRCLCAGISQSLSPDDAIEKLKLLNDQKSLPADHLENLKIEVKENDTLMTSSELLSNLNELLDKNGIESINQIESNENENWDDVPF